MTSSLASSQPASLAVDPAWRSGWFSRFFAFTPLWIRIYGFFAWQPVFHGMYPDPSGPMGIPQGVFVDGLVMLWMVIGAYVLWGARSRLVAALVYLVFTIPATVAVIFGPAILLIVQNLS